MAMARCRTRNTMAALRRSPSRAGRLRNDHGQRHHLGRRRIRRYPNQPCQIRIPARSPSPARTDTAVRHTVEGGTLAVVGSLPAARTVTVGSGGTLNPGTVGTTGTLATGAATINGTLAIDINASASDRLVVTGNLDLTGSALALNVLAIPAATPYIIASYTGTLTGTLGSPPSGYTVNYGSGTKTSSPSPNPPPTITPGVSLQPVHRQRRRRSRWRRRQEPGGIRLRPDSQQRLLDQPDHQPAQQVHQEVQLHPPQDFTRHQPDLLGLVLRKSDRLDQGHRCHRSRHSHSEHRQRNRRSHPLCPPR